MLGSAIPRRWTFSLALVGLVSILVATYSAMGVNPAFAADSKGTGPGSGTATTLPVADTLSDARVPQGPIGSEFVRERRCGEGVADQTQRGPQGEAGDHGKDVADHLTHSIDSFQGQFSLRNRAGDNGSISLNITYRRRVLSGTLPVSMIDLRLSTIIEPPCFIAFVDFVFGGMRSLIIRNRVPPSASSSS